MIYYFGLIGAICIFRLLTAGIKENKRARSVFFVLTALIVIAFQGFRSFNVGIDLGSYIPGFMNIGNDESIKLGNLVYQNYEAGYVLLNKLLYKLGCSPRVFLFIVSAIIQIPIFYTMYRYSDKPLLSIFIYFAFGNFLFTFSGLRQSIAMALCFVAFGFIKRKKLLPFLMMVLLASSFHSSALLCIVLYPVYHFEMDKHWLPLALSAVIFLIVFNEKLLIFVSGLGYGGYGEVTRTGAYTMLSMYFLLYFVSFLGKKYNRDYMGLRNILLILTMIYTLAPVSNHATRVGYPLALYMTIFIPKVTMQFDVRPKWLYDTLCSLLCLACFFSFLGYLDTLPFSFF